MKIAFLVPENKHCGVRDYSETLLQEMKKQSKYTIVKKQFKKTNNFLYYYFLARELSKEFDVIHIQHEFGLFGLFGKGFFFFANGCSKPLVVTFHEFHVNSLPIYIKEKLIMLFSGWKINKAIVLSKEGEKIAQKFISKRKIINIGFGFKLKVGQKQNGNKNVIHSGFFRSGKNQKFTIELARLLPDINFVFAGEEKGAYYEEVKKSATGIKNVEFTGFLSKKELDKRIGNANLVILPYEKIVQSAAFYDALSMGKTILTSNLGFFKEMEKEGVSFTAHLNAKQYAKKVRELVKSKNKTLNAIKEFEKENSWNKVAKRNLQIYNDL